MKGIISAKGNCMCIGRNQAWKSIKKMKTLVLTIRTLGELQLSPIFQMARAVVIMPLS